MVGTQLLLLLLLDGVVEVGNVFEATASALLSSNLSLT